MADSDAPEPIFGAVSPKRSMDHRLYEDLGADFEPTFVNVKPKPATNVAHRPNQFLIRKKKDNPFIKKEARTLASLRKEWEEHLKPEHEKIEPLIADVFKVDKRVRATFVKDLKVNMDSIEAFFIKEIAPVEVALIDALERSRQTIAMITESEVEHESLEVLTTMFREAVKLKSFDFLCEKLALPSHLRQVLIEKYFKHEQKRP